MTRTQLIKASSWNRAYLQEKHKEHQLPPQLIPVECAINSAHSLTKTDTNLDRAIDRLLNRAVRLERRLRYVNSNFPSLGIQIANCETEQTNYELTNDEPIQVVETTQPDEKNEFPLVTDDPSEVTRAAYELFFPGRELIVIEPTDAVTEPRP
ncbi:MAG: hypothetical protein ACKV2U_32605 [Bryobacteraceae bacterium]